MIEQEYQCLLTAEGPIALMGNHIQVGRAGRKVFRGAKADLVFTGVQAQICIRDDHDGVLVIKESPFTLWNLYEMDANAWISHELGHDGAFIHF